MLNASPSFLGFFTLLMGGVSAVTIWGLQLLLTRSRTVSGAPMMYMIAATLAVLPLFDIWAHQLSPWAFLLLFVYVEVLRRITLFLAGFWAHRSLVIAVWSATVLPTILGIAEDCTGLAGDVFEKWPRAAHRHSRIIVLGTRWRGTGILFPRTLGRDERRAIAQAVGKEFGSWPRLKDRPREAYVLVPVGAFLLGFLALGFVFS